MIERHIDICIRIPDPDRVFKARSKWEDEE